MDIPYTVQPRQDTGLYNAKVGIWLFLGSEVMLFGALFSSYILLRVGSLEGFWPHGWLNVPIGTANTNRMRSEEHTSELQSRLHLVCRLLLEKKKKQNAL